MVTVPNLRRAVLGAGVAVVLASAGTAATVDLATAEVVDLSHPFDERTIYWPTAPSTFQLTRLHHGLTPGGFFYAANSFCTPEHGGTHFDAPIHFAEGRRTTDRLGLDHRNRGRPGAGRRLVRVAGTGFSRNTVHLIS